MEMVSLLLILLTAVSALVFLVYYSIWVFHPNGPASILGWWLILLNSALLLLAGFSAAQTVLDFVAHPVIRVVVLGLVAAAVTVQPAMLYCTNKDKVR